MKDKIIEKIAAYKKVPADKISTSATWAELGLDSLDVTEMVMDMEDELGIEVDLNPEIKSIDDLVAYIESIQ